jgi:hypothetical protein
VERETTRDEITLHRQDIRTNNQPAHNPMRGKREDQKGCPRGYEKNFEGPNGRRTKDKVTQVQAEPWGSSWFLVFGCSAVCPTAQQKGKLELTALHVLFLLFPHLVTQLD